MPGDRDPKRRTLGTRVPPAAAGTTLLDWLVARFRYKDRDAWVVELAGGRVHLDGTRADGREVLTAGETVTWQRSEPEPWVRDDVRIVDEDDDLLVVDKPPHLPVHADGAFVRNTLVGLLTARGAHGRLRVVHRLDRETSGVVVLAKTRSAAGRLTDAFRAGEVTKRYAAVAHGLVGAVGDVLHIDRPIARSKDSAISLRRACIADGSSADTLSSGTLSSDTLSSDNAQQARTTVEVVAVDPARDRSLVRLRPDTGRTHQLRVHLEAIGHPLVGDKLYGRTDAGYLAFVHHVKAGGRPDDPAIAPWPGRCLLHAESLGFAHPRTGTDRSFTVPWPDDLRGALAMDEVPDR